MYPVAKVRVHLDSRNDVGMEITREGGRKLNTRKSGGRNCSQQTTKWSRSWKTLEPVFNTWPVTIHVLPDQVNLFVTESLQFLCFSNDLARRPAALATTRIRNDTKRTKLVAAFDDGNEGDMSRVSLDWRNIPRIVFTALAEVENFSLAAARSFD